MTVTKAAPRRGEVPQSAGAERALIACVLIDEWQTWGELTEEPIGADDFFAPEHKAIWAALCWCRDNGFDCATPTACYALQQLGLIDRVDAWCAPSSAEVYLTDIAGEHWTAVGAVTYARIVKDYARRRGMLREAQRLAQAAHEPKAAWKALPEYEVEG